MMDKKIIKEAHVHCIKNENEIKNSIFCICFYCTARFTPTDIKQWIREKRIEERLKTRVPSTALCPCCGIDAVIGSASNIDLSDEFVKEMNEFWFNEII